MTISTLNSISSLRVWYDFSDANYVTVNGSNEIQSVLNKATTQPAPSGSSDLTPASGSILWGKSIRTQNNKTVADCNGTDSLEGTAFTTALTQPYTMFFAGVTDISNTQYLMRDLTGNVNWFTQTLNDTIAFEAGTFQFPNTIVDPTVPFIHAIVVNGASSEYYSFNEGGRMLLGGTVGADSLDGIGLIDAVGGSNSLDGAIFECGVFHAALSTSELSSLFDYLVRKWLQPPPLGSTSIAQNSGIITQ